MKNFIIGSVAALALILSVVGLASRQQPVLGGTTNFDRLELTQGLSVSDSSRYASTRFASSSTSGGINSYVNSTTTATLSQSDLVGYSTVGILASTTAASTITLPASSTLTTLVANSGDVANFTIVNSSATATHVLTIAGGTGTTLQTASTSAVLAASKTGMLRLVRLPSTDVIAQFVPFGY